MLGSPARQPEIQLHPRRLVLWHLAWERVHTHTTAPRAHAIYLFATLSTDTGRSALFASLEAAVHGAARASGTTQRTAPSGQARSRRRSPLNSKQQRGWPLRSQHSDAGASTTSRSRDSTARHTA